MQRALRTLFALVFCAASAGIPARTFAQANDPIRIAAEYGLAYAPLYVIAKKPEFIRKYLPNANVTLVQLAGGAAVREALISNTVDVGAMAMSPVIQGWDKGADIKIASGLSFMPFELITYRPDLKSVKDLKPGDKVNVISIGSPQTLVMKMAAQKYFGGYDALDDLFVVMPHPDAVAAVLAHRDIVAEFASPPFIRALMSQPGMHVMLTNRDFPEANFMYVAEAASGNFVRQRPDAYNAIVRATKDAIDWINAKPADAAAFLATDQAGKMTAADWLAEIKQPGVKFTAVPTGLHELSIFMKNIGMTSKAGTYDDLTWPNLHGAGGN